MSCSSRTLLAPTGKESFTTWRVDGLPDTMTEHGVTTTYIYDAMGNVANTSDTLGRTSTFTRDAAGNVLTFNDGATTVTSGYDANNRLTSTTDALGNTTTYGYTIAGCGCSQDDLVTSIHTPDLPADRAWTFSYGAEGRLGSVTDPDGRKETYEYETTGELKKVVDRLLRSTTTGHDQLGRVTSLIDALGRAHARSYPVPSLSGLAGPKLFAGSAGATAPSIDVVAALASGDYQIGENTYDLRTIPLVGPGSRGYPQKTLYRDATFALTWQLQTDLAGRLTQRVDHATGGGLFFQQLFYDARTTSPLVGLFNTTVSGGLRNGRLDHNPNFDLDDALGIAGGFQPEADYFFTRDPGGRLSGVARSYPLIGPAFAAPASTYTYFANGKLKKRIDVDGQHDYAHDARGLLQSIATTEGVYTFEYDAVGRNTRLVFPDSHVRVQQYDNEGRTTSRCYTYSDASKTRCYTADYDAVGNPTRMTDPEGTEVIEYDALDRLARATRSSAGQPDAVEDYAYNALGALSVNAGVALDMQRPRLDNPAVLADSAVPRTFNGQPVVLDGAGRITALDGMTLAYSALSQLTGVQAGGQSEVYYLDALSRRWGRTANGQTEIYVFDELAGTDVVGVIDTIGATKETYLFDGTDHPLRLRRGGFVFFYEVDLAGNVRRLRDPSGADLGGYRYTAFGKSYAADATTPDPAAQGAVQPLRWKARWLNPLTGLYDVRARQWSPELGAFTAIDEFVFQSMMTTLWGWPRQNPFKSKDPSGHGDPCGGSCDQCCGPQGPAPGECCKICWVPHDKEKCLKECDDQYERDNERCRNLPDPGDRSRCYEKATNDYGKCRRRCNEQ